MIELSWVLPLVHEEERRIFKQGTLPTVPYLHLPCLRLPHVLHKGCFTKLPFFRPPVSHCVLPIVSLEPYI